MSDKPSVYSKTKKFYNGLDNPAKNYFAVVMGLADTNGDVFKKDLQRRNDIKSGKPYTPIKKLSVKDAVLSHNLAHAERLTEPDTAKKINNYFSQDDVLHELTHGQFYKQFGKINFPTPKAKEQGFKMPDYTPDIQNINNAGQFYNNLSRNGKTFFMANLQASRYSVSDYNQMLTAPNLKKLSPHQQHERGYLARISENVPSDEDRNIVRFFSSPKTQSSIKHHTLQDSLGMAESTDREHNIKVHSAKLHQPERYDRILTQGTDLYGKLSKTGQKYMLANVRSANYDFDKFSRIRDGRSSQLSPHDEQSRKFLHSLATGQVASKNDGHMIQRYDPMPHDEKRAVDSYLDNPAFRESMMNGDAYNRMYRIIIRERNLAETRQDDEHLPDPYEKFGGHEPSWGRRNDRHHPFAYRMGYKYGGLVIALHHHVANDQSRLAYASQRSDGRKPDKSQWKRTRWGQKPSAVERAKKANAYFSKKFHERQYKHATDHSRNTGRER